MIDAYIGLGSNLENPLRQLQAAVHALEHIADSRLSHLSAIYRSNAVGPGAQPDYLNAVARLKTGLDPIALLDALQAIEAVQGRERKVRWGPRTLDLDLLLYGDQRIEQPRLTIPHPRMTERDFVLFPLVDIAGSKLLLPNGEELGKLVAACPEAGAQRTRLSLFASAGNVPGESDCSRAPVTGPDAGDQGH